jgi:hypothetical protein
MVAFGNMADTAARNQRLQQLVAATQAWATSRTTVLNNQATSAQAILNGRTGATQLAQAGVDAASMLVVSQIDDFLSG